MSHQELQSIVESFGNVTNCEVFQSKTISTGYVRSVTDIVSTMSVFTRNMLEWRKKVLATG